MRIRRQLRARGDAWWRRQPTFVSSTMPRARGIAATSMGCCLILRPAAKPSQTPRAGRLSDKSRLRSAAVAPVAAHAAAAMQIR